MPRVEIHFDLRGQTAGMVRFTPTGTAHIRYNRDLLKENGEAFIRQIPAHEVAHVASRHIYGRQIRPHGPEWQSVMKALNADPSRCHSFDTRRTRVRRVGRSPYHCQCREHMISSIRVNRIQRGQRYLCRSCGEELRPGRLPMDG